jgi:hypothetical protein
MLKLGLILLSNITGIVKDLNSGENKEKMFHIAMAKNGRKAMNIAEDYFMVVKENFEKLPKKVQKKLLKLEDKFNDLD